LTFENKREMCIPSVGHKLFGL